MPYIIVFVGFCIIMLIKYLWPLLPIIAAAAALALLLRNWDDRQYQNTIRRRQELRDLIARADAQHKNILDGNIQQGTYGQYLPPKGLRKLPWT